jgi:hypothetical protein
VRDVIGDGRLDAEGTRSRDQCTTESAPSDIVVCAWQSTGCQVIAALVVQSVGAGCLV